jgi:hypothetical protein
MSNDLLGIHSIYSVRKEGNGYHDFDNFSVVEFLYLALSCYYWRKLNGPIKLVTDEKFLKLVNDLGISWMWDEIDLETLKKLPTDINYDIFWTYPKMFVQFQQKERFAVVDADLFSKISIKDYTEDIVYGHEEMDLVGLSYPTFFTEPQFKSLLTGTDLWAMMPDNSINTCLVVYNDLDILEELKSITERFVRVGDQFLTHPNKDWIYTIYCEQRVLGNIIKRKGYKYKCLAKYPYDVRKLEAYSGLVDIGIEHLWSGKKHLRVNEGLRLTVIQSMLRYIYYELPELYQKIAVVVDKIGIK